MEKRELHDHAAKPGRPGRRGHTPTVFVPSEVKKSQQLLLRRDGAKIQAGEPWCSGIPAGGLCPIRSFTTGPGFLAQFAMGAGPCDSGTWPHINRLTARGESQVLKGHDFSGAASN